MLKLFPQSKELCCGCGACFQVCPHNCIVMNEDEEGFSYPFINQSKCINCGLCKKVCPFNSSLQGVIPLDVYAAINTDSLERTQSSSGGIFSVIADAIIKQGGIVFGAKFDKDWSVYHVGVENMEELNSLRGSKYLQSWMGDEYRHAEEELKKGRKVLFCGTPCQIAGLKHYLHMDYDNLITIDFVCHGVPSPKLWKWYLNHSLSIRSSDITGVCFRDKTNGWSNYEIRIDHTGDSNNSVYAVPFWSDSYMKAFLSNLSLRPSCYSCKVKCGRSHSDMTLGDFWGVDNIAPSYYDDKGTSLVMTNTLKSTKLLESDNIKKSKVDFKQAIANNWCWERSVEKNDNRALFFRRYKKHPEDFDDFVKEIEHKRSSVFALIKRRLKRWFY